MGRQFLPGLLARGRVELETKDYNWSASSPQAWFNNLSAAGRRAWPIDRAVAEGYERTVWVYKGVGAISSHQSTLDFQVGEGDDIVEDHPLAVLLNDGQANPLETGRQFRKRLSDQVQLSPAGSFVEITWSNGGEPIRLDLLPPGRTRPVPGRGAELLSHFETIASDGTRVPIPAKNVLWFRDPHPTDPYRGITPLEAAGLSVDLDYLSRLYNVIFIRNDGRPATAIGVEGKLSPAEAARIEERFGRGPLEAGKVSVLNGKLTVADLAAHPRDMAYGEMAARAKEEVLTAFGVGESVLGNASGRTWDNAEQELYNFWTITMPPHLSIIATGFGPLLKGLTPRFDTSTVEVLRRTAAAQRAEAREEVAAGLISPDEYREIADYEPIDLPQTRALYIAQGKTPIPSREEDMEALGLGTPEGEPPPGEAPPQGPAGPGAEAGAPDPAAEGEPPAGEQATFDPADPATSQAFAALQGILDEAGTPIETKALPNPADIREPDGPDEQDERDPHEEELAAALDQLARRLIERTAARVASPKARKGTRHFEPEPGFELDTRVGDQPLDTGRIIDPAQWEAEAETTLAPAVEAAALAAVAALIADPLAVGETPGPGDDLRGAAVSVAADVTSWLGSQIAGVARRIAMQIAADDTMGRDMAGIVAEVRAQLPPLQAWSKRAAVQVVTHLVHAAQAAAARVIAGPGGLVSATWRARDDAATRLTHRDADGQTRVDGDPFQVGGARLRWPGDLDGPIEETAFCRCRLTWMISRSSGRTSPARR